MLSSRRIAATRASRSCSGSDMRNSGLIVELQLSSFDEGVEELAPMRALLLFNGSVPYALSIDKDGGTLFALDMATLRHGVRVVGGSIYEDAKMALGLYDVDL